MITLRIHNGKELSVQTPVTQIGAAKLKEDKAVVLGIDYTKKQIFLLELSEPGGKLVWKRLTKNENKRIYKLGEL